MKKLIRLVLIGAIGTIGIFFIGRNSLSARWQFLGLGDESALGSSEDEYQPVFLTEWLAGDVLRTSLAPVLVQTEGTAAETMRAYADLHDARRDSEALVEEHKRADKHQKTKNLAIDRLVAREIRLLDVATTWLEADRAYGHGKTDIINRVYPGNTELDKYCHRVIRELELFADRQPQRYWDAFAGAREEMRVLKAQGSYPSSNGAVTDRSKVFIVAITLRVMKRHLLPTGLGCSSRGQVSAVNNRPQHADGKR